MNIEHIICNEVHIQGASGKSVLFLNACIYPCNGRTRLSKVPLETYRSQEDFDVFHVSIGHSELSLEQFEIFLKIYPERHLFLAILAIFGGPKSREDVNFCPPNHSSHLYSIWKGNWKKEMGSKSSSGIFFRCLKIVNLPKMLKN